MIMLSFATLSVGWYRALVARLRISFRTRISTFKDVVKFLINAHKNGSHKEIDFFARLMEILVVFYIFLAMFFTLDVFVDLSDNSEKIDYFKALSSAPSILNFFVVTLFVFLINYLIGSFIKIRTETLFKKINTQPLDRGMSTLGLDLDRGDHFLDFKESSMDKINNDLFDMSPEEYGELLNSEEFRKELKIGLEERYAKAVSVDPFDGGKTDEEILFEYLEIRKQKRLTHSS